MRVEDRLDQQLVRLIVPTEPVEADAEAVEMAPEEDADYKQVAEAVMRESIINLARIKETYSQSMVSQGSSQGIDAVPALIRGIKAGLLMLNKTRAMQVVEQVGVCLRLHWPVPGRAGLRKKKQTDLRTQSSVLSTTWKRSRLVGASRGTCSTTPRPASLCCAIWKRAWQLNRRKSRLHLFADDENRGARFR